MGGSWKEKTDLAPPEGIATKQNKRRAFASGRAAKENRIEMRDEITDRKN